MGTPDRTCSQCGTPLAPNESFCSNCGRRYEEPAMGGPTQLSSSSSAYNFGASPNDPTVVASSDAPPSVPPGSQYDPAIAASPSPSTAYGSQHDATIAASPYSAPPPPSYSSPTYAPPPPPSYSSPTYAPPPPSYTVPQPTPRPPSTRSQGSRIGIIVGVGILVLLLIGGGVFVLVRPNNTSATPTPTGLTTAQVNATGTAKANAQANATGTAQAQATATANVGATATATANQNPYPPYTGALVLSDPMTDNSRGYKWDDATIGGVGTCGFSGGAYHLRAPQKGIICVPEASNLVFSNLAFEAKLTLIQGDQESIVFRLNQNVGTYYAFYVLSDGTYSINAVKNNSIFRTLRGSSPAINKGQNSTNLLAIVANGKSINLYVNNQLVNRVNDDSITQSGQIGVGDYSTSGAADVAVTDVRVWAL